MNEGDWQLQQWHGINNANQNKKQLCGKGTQSYRLKT